MPDPLHTPVRRVPELDGIRGIAITLVLIWHYAALPILGGRGRASQSIYSYLNLTWSGVDLFFVLSGFLLGGILLDNRQSPNLLKVFYARRCLRILPLYFLVVAVYFAAAAADWSKSAGLRWIFDNGLPFWTYATFTQNFLMAEVGNCGAHWLGVTWSLAVEEQFYLVLPFMIRFVSRKRLVPILLTLIIAAPALRVVLFFVHPQSAYPGLLLMPARADALLLGVLGAFLMRIGSVRHALERNVRRLYFVALALLLCLVVLNRSGAEILSLPMTSVGHTLLAILYLSTVLIALNEEPNGPIRILARLPVLRFLGVISFGVYMYHQVVSGLLYSVLLNHPPVIRSAQDVAVTALALVVTILVSLGSWHLFEKRLIRFGQHLKYQP